MAGPLCRSTVILLGCCLLATAQSLVHPGGILNQEEIQLMRARVRAGTSPWRAAAQKVYAKADLAYVPRALPYIYIGGEGKCFHSEKGVWVAHTDCTHQHQAMIEDGERSIAFAYAYLLTSDGAYARKAVAIMKAWNDKCKKIYSMRNLPNGDEIALGQEGTNAPLELGWMMAGMGRSAELLKYSYPGWAASGAGKALLAFWARARPHMDRPFVIWKDYNNWHATILEARMMMAIFANDAAGFRALCAQFKEQMIGKGILANSLTNDTRRDTWHGQAVFGGLVQCAEIAFHQGIDLYGAEDNKIMKSMEANADWGLKNNWDFVPVWEIGYNHYVNRRHLAMPRTEAFILKFGAHARPDDLQFHWGWEFLTHYSTAGGP